jgi:hypothetical protein
MMKAFLLGAGISLLIPAMAPAQTTQAVRHPKPDYKRNFCSAAELGYRLVAMQPPTSYRAVNIAAPGGYDPNASIDSCGPVVAAQPLTCVDGSGVPVGNPEMCEPNARGEYELNNVVNVYRNVAAGLPFYSVSSKNLGVVLATGIRITRGKGSSCIWLTEVEVYSGSANVALKSSGATANSSAYEDWSSRDAPINGNVEGSSGSFRTQCKEGDFYSVTFRNPSAVDRLTIYARDTYQNDTDGIMNYEILNGSNVIARGVMDMRSSPHSGTTSLTTLPGCAAQSFNWKTASTTPAGVCGTQEVPVGVSCVDADGATVNDALCDPGTRPSSTRTVTSTDGCVADYQTTAWSTAAPTCGNVRQTRTVSCVGADGRDMGETTCALRLTPPEGRNPSQIADSEYWSKGVYAWPGVANARIWRMSTTCDVSSSPAEVARECELVYVAKSGVNQPYLRPLSARTIEDRRACQSDVKGAYHWNDPTYVPDRTGMCGTNTRSGVVRCLDGSGAQVDEGLCDARTKPPSTQSFEDLSGCPGSDQSGVQIAQIQLGTCNATTSGGRYACGPRGSYRNGPTAPWPNELCSGNLIYGSVDGNYVGTPDYTKTSTRGWTTPPGVLKVPGARCVVHWKVGYSDSQLPGWVSAYYDGQPTGREGGMFIGR